MGDIVSFQAHKSKQKAAPKKNTLCRNGHHAWEIDKKKQFDVKQGKLVTIKRCKRCGKQKVLTL